MTRSTSFQLWFQVPNRTFNFRSLSSGLMFNFPVNVWFDPVVALIVILSGPEPKSNPLALLHTETKSERFTVLICQFICNTIRKCWVSLWVPSDIALVARFAYQELFSVVEVQYLQTRRERKRANIKSSRLTNEQNRNYERVEYSVLGGRFLCYYYRMKNVVKLAQIQNRITIVDLISIRSSIHQQKSPRLRVRRKYP